MSIFHTHVNAHVLHLCFGATGTHNVMRDEWFADLEKVLREAAGTPEVRCLLLSAEGESFSSGGDLQQFLAGPMPDGAMKTAMASCLAYFERFDKPIVATVHGAAIGGGSTVLLHCDFVFADPQTTFQLPFTRIGIVPELGSTALLALHAGQRLATELLLLGRPFDAATALKAGIVNDLVAGPALAERAAECAQSLAALPPHSLRATKRLLRSAFSDVYADAWRNECVALEQCFEGPEVKEACQAFLDKRQPDFSSFV